MLGVGGAAAVSGAHELTAMTETVDKQRDHLLYVVLYREQLGIIFVQHYVSPFDADMRIAIDLRS